MRLRPLSLAMCGLVASVHADRVDDYIFKQMKRRDIPGLSIAIVKNERVIKARGYGFADLEQRVSASAHTVYDIGSTAKQFAATLVVMLEREGKLGFDDPVTKHLPELGDTWSGVTLRHLLTHTSGKKSVTVLSSRPEYTTEQFLRLAARTSTEFLPGQRWAYNNTGYHLLGLIVERVRGESFWKVLDRQFFRSHGMTATRSTDPQAIISNRARGYVFTDGRHENVEAVSPASVHAAGGLVSTVLDLAKWDIALSTGRVLPPSVLERMWTPTDLSGAKTYPYGFGWFLDRPGGRRNIRHGGQSLGFASSLSRYPEDKLTVIVLTNLGRANAHAIADGIVALYLADTVRARDSNPARTASFKALLNEMAAGKLRPQAFDDKAFARIFPGGPQQAQKAMKPLGRLESLRLLARNDDALTLADRFLAEFEKGEFVLTFSRDREGKITAFSVAEAGWRPPPSP